MKEGRKDEEIEIKSGLKEGGNKTKNKERIIRVIMKPVGFSI